MTDDNIETVGNVTVQTATYDAIERHNNRVDPNKDVPLYRSHKTVRALEINICAMVAGGKRVVVFTDKKYPSQTFDAQMFVRYSPVPGDFLVIYEDGYRSFSPRKAFLEGYTLVEG